MRVFFALPLSRECRDATERWRQANLLFDGRRVPASNFHITLCFLGSLDDRQVSAISAAADRIPMEPFDCTLDTPGYFPRPGVFWIGPAETPPPLASLAGALEKAARRAGLSIERRPYRPHLTLVRKCREPVTPPLRPPRINLRCNRFCLMESRSGKSGVNYIPLRSWPSGPARCW
jgi:2'-5' RNA ligase